MFKEPLEFVGEQRATWIERNGDQSMEQQRNFEQSKALRLDHSNRQLQKVAVTSAYWEWQ